MQHYITYINTDGAESLPINLNTICARYPQGTLNCPHGRDFHQILFIIDGEGSVTCENKTYKLEKGCAFFTAANIGVCYHSTDHLTTAFVTVRGDAITQLMAHYNTGSFLFRESVDLGQYISSLNTIIDAYFGQKSSGTLSALAYSLYVNFFESQVKNTYQMKEVALYLERNFSHRITLSALAEAFGISVSTLSHKFKKEYRCTVIQYLLNVRLNYARNALQLNPNQRIGELSAQCGFEDESYFCKAFKQKFSKTPSEILRAGEL